MSQKLKDKILLAALPDVTFDGWSAGLFLQAARKIGMPEDDVRALFPKGPLDLILHFSDWADRAVLEKLPPPKKFMALKVRERIALGVRTRLEALAPHKDALRQSLGFFALPWRKPLLAKMVWKSADHIWHAAGDAATDYNYYSKRTLLAGVMSSTTLCWLGDSSKNHQDTWEFLDRRIDNVLKIGQLIGRFKKKAA